MAPSVLLSFNIPNAMFGNTHAKYKKNTVDVTFCGVLFPMIPAKFQKKKLDASQLTIKPPITTAAEYTLCGIYTIAIKLSIFHLITPLSF